MYLSIHDFVDAKIFTKTKTKKTIKKKRGNKTFPPDYSIPFFSGKRWELIHDKTIITNKKR